ncbi:hypothetical protein Fcan01_27554 [Folsomia candida]|uniref:Uncharacterized protein n=1 Tax=Folsomia candida TaxID=158441 RepID=A0A226CY66_FOLCA|nr:hypothetical protein Fcan01_27554 [Folsomia candida]
MRDQVLIRKLESKINIFKNENTTNYEPQGWKHIKNIAKRHGGSAGIIPIGLKIKNNWKHIPGSGNIIQSCQLKLLKLAHDEKFAEAPIAPPLDAMRLTTKTPKDPKVKEWHQLIVKYDDLSISSIAPKNLHQRPSNRKYSDEIREYQACQKYYQNKELRAYVCLFVCFFGLPHTLPSTCPDSLSFVHPLSRINQTAHFIIIIIITCRPVPPPARNKFSSSSLYTNFWATGFRGSQSPPPPSSSRPPPPPLQIGRRVLGAVNPNHHQVALSLDASKVRGFKLPKGEYTWN